MTSPKKPSLPKPSIKDLQKETIPHHLKNTKQKMDALDDINALIEGATDLSYLHQHKEPLETIESSSKDTEIYGLSKERDQEYDNFKQESIGHGIVMSFENEE
jgi:hypothetical protein